MAVRFHRPCRPVDLFLSLLVGALAATDAASQEPITPLQFSFSDPGARSLGFGGAFVALADDATAAFSNPAGLVQLVRPEVSIEGRRWSYSTPYTEGGRVEGLPSGIGIDTTAGLRTARSDDVLTGLSFLSVAYPKGRWSFALFRHQLANFRFSSETQGLFGGGSACCQTYLYDQRVTSELDFVSYGLSGAVRLGGSFNVGLGAIYHSASLDSKATPFLPDDDSPESAFAPTSFLPTRSLLSEEIIVDDAAWALTGGFLWRPSESWRIGGVYRQGPRVELAAEFRAGEAIDLGVPPGEVLLRVAGFSVQIPPALGLGVAYRDPGGGLTVSFQWDRVEYSRIAESLRLDDERIDDANELHLGGEYVFLGWTPIVAVRIGAWLDPDHQLRSFADDPFLRALKPRGEDQMHYALGLGVALRSFQIDAGVDVADRVDTASVSAVFSF